MDKFEIKCPKCGNVFNLSKGELNYFQEMQVASYNDHTLLICPNCKYYETDKKEKINPKNIRINDS